MEIKNEKILIIAAHPDDEVLGCGGLINKLHTDNEINVLILGEGSTCREFYSISDVEMRKNGSLEAFEILTGKKNVEFGLGECGKFRLHDPKIIKGKIEEKIKNFYPTIVFSHYHSDTNIDHTVVHEYTKISTRPYLKNNIHSVYYYEVPSSSDRSGFVPNVYFELSEKNMNSKVDAMRKFTTEQNYKQRQGDGIISLAKYRGSHIGKEYAEAFVLDSMKYTL